MAINLQKAVFQVLAYDLNKDKIKELEQAGIVGCDLVKEVVGQVDDAIITMVRNKAQTESVIFEEDGVTSAHNKGITVVVMSTLNPTIMSELEKDVLDADFNIVDAPVIGSLSGADNGS